ncbi:hypothetical protein SVIOM342S_09335 [Streptomyces violaceorubidus]
MRAVQWASTRARPQPSSSRASAGAGGRRGAAEHFAYVDDELVALHVDADREPSVRSSGRAPHGAGEQLAADHRE